jgi:hypothetical protein
VSLTLEDFRDAVDPDPTWLPGTKRLEVVDNERHLAVACHDIFVFARSFQLVTTNVEARAIELEAYDINSWLSIIVHGGNPCKGLRFQESQFLLRKHGTPPLLLLPLWFNG